MMGAENTRGLGRYIQELVAAMAAMAPDNEYVLVTRRADHALAALPHIKTVVADIPWYGLDEQIKMPRIFRDLKADVVHVPHWNVPLAYSGPLVVTVHDLLLLHQPASANASTRVWPVRLFKRLGFRLTLRHAVSAAQRICVPTEFVKDDLLNFFPAAQNKIVVTGEGVTRFRVSSNEFRVTQDQGPRAKDRSRSYLLYVGSAYPHKRVDLLLKAWETVSAKRPDLELVVAGEMDAFMQRQKAISEERKLPRVSFLGRVTDAELSALFSGASAFVWPSSFEGFGLGPVEALSTGCPVISSDVRPMPEVLGKKGVAYFKTGSVDGMIEAINEVVDNQSVYRSQALSAVDDLLDVHDWNKAAARTLAAYGQALGQGESATHLK